MNVECKAKIIEMASKEHVPFSTILNKVIDTCLSVMDGENKTRVVMLILLSIRMRD